MIKSKYLLITVFFILSLNIMIIPVCPAEELPDALKGYIVNSIGVDYITKVLDGNNNEVGGSEINRPKITFNDPTYTFTKIEATSEDSPAYSFTLVKTIPMILILDNPRVPTTIKSRDVETIDPPGANIIGGAVVLGYKICSPFPLPIQASITELAPEPAFLDLYSSCSYTLEGLHKYYAEFTVTANERRANDYGIIFQEPALVITYPGFVGASGLWGITVPYEINVELKITISGTVILVGGEDVLETRTDTDVAGVGDFAWDTYLPFFIIGGFGIITIILIIIIIRRRKNRI